jgi:peptidoglycan/xylan/chitin deacetylase (PgdA/CDA1 family)
MILGVDRDAVRSLARRISNSEEGGVDPSRTIFHVIRAARPPLALAYHGVADVPLRRDRHHLFVRPRDLERQIAKLREWGYDIVSFGELARRVAEDRSRGCAALTFDDGLSDNLYALVPILQAASATATVFVVSGWLGRPYPIEPWARILTTDELRQLAAAGIEIGAHTVRHPDLTKLSFAQAFGELADSKAALEEVVEAPVETAAYPYGHASAETRAAAREAGFRAACRTLGEGSWADPFDLPRQTMENRASLMGLRLKRHSRYEPFMRLRAARGARRLSRRIREVVGG